MPVNCYADASVGPNAKRKAAVWCLVSVCPVFFQTLMRLWLSLMPQHGQCDAPQCTFQQFCLRVDILVFSNHAVETGHWSALLRLTDTHVCVCVCVCVAENYYRYYVWTVKYQDYRYVFLQTTMFQNASCHMNYSFTGQQLVAFNCAKAILLIVVQPCFWLTLELRIKVELCEPFARQYDRLLSSWPSAVATLVSLGLRYDTIRDAILTCARKPT